MKKAIFRTCSMSILILYMVLLFPTHLNVLLDYFSLKNEKLKLDLEMTVIADSLLSSKDVDTIIKNSKADISLSTVMENGDSSTLRTYDGSELEPSGNRVLEYIIKGDGNNNYLFGYLSSYQLSYSSISINENQEIILRVFSS